MMASRSRQAARTSYTPQDKYRDPVTRFQKLREVVDHRPQLRPQVGTPARPKAAPPLVLKTPCLPVLRYLLLAVVDPGVHCEWYTLAPT